MPVITKRLVARAKPRARRYEITCASLRGFILRVLPSGKKVYYARLREQGRDVRQRIGLVGELEFAEARARASEVLTGSASFSATKASAASWPSSSTRARPVTPLFRDFVRRFDSGHIATAIKASTASRYRSSIRNHLTPTFGGRRLGEIGREDVERWFGSMRNNPNAANTAIRVLSCMFSKAIDWGALPPNHRSPTRGVRKYRQRVRERFLTPDERARLEAVLDRGLEPRATNHHGVLHWSTVGVIRLLAYTGMRRSEVLGLTWDMVDLRHRVFRLPDSKTGQRAVPFGSAVHQLLVEELLPKRAAGVPWVCVSKHGTPVSPGGIGRTWRRVRKKAALGEMRLHDLRHSAASDALMGGVPLAVVGKILGHRNPSTTARYAHLSDKVVQDAVEVMSASIERARKKNREPAEKTKSSPKRIRKSQKRK